MARVHYRGMTFIDISKPHDVRYCFLERSLISSQAVTLMGADAQLGSYYDEDEKPQLTRFKSLLDRFKGIKVITAYDICKILYSTPWEDSAGTDTPAEEEKPLSNGTFYFRSLRASANEEYNSIGSAAV